MGTIFSRYTLYSSTYFKRHSRLIKLSVANLWTLSNEPSVTVKLTIILCRNLRWTRSILRARIAKYSRFRHLYSSKCRGKASPIFYDPSTNNRNYHLYGYFQGVLTHVDNYLRAGRVEFSKIWLVSPVSWIHSCFWLFLKYNF